ncbi:MAG: hypothetical protein ACOX0K_07570 [Oscillospiraceae bacterium]|jgi:hypothetical protein
MSYVSRRTEHVLAVVEEIKRRVYQEIDQTPEEMCSEHKFQDIVTQSFSKVAKKHRVGETTVRDACTRSSDIDCVEDFLPMVRDAITGGFLLEEQLIATAKNNESGAEISAAFAKI